ncbi:hypothetical protein [Bradyrhizobium sp.]|uniref:hypothetical protein n=1 Tax=Bradyrhizobium sp. TaxID=376 RepID=UPI002DDD1881|nr:hypothetical protein [Bradyrhizobium sp.]HEV2156602.1 hypothetical protein [Bradyrhizobium sp.]
MNHLVRRLLKFSHRSASHRMPVLRRANNAVQLARVDFDMRSSLSNCSLDLGLQLFAEIVHSHHDRPLADRQHSARSANARHGLQGNKSGSNKRERRTMPSHPLANTPGFIAARNIVQKEHDKAQKEVDFSNKPGSTFSAANRDRAILRRDVLATLLKDLN